MHITHLSRHRSGFTNFSFKYISIGQNEFISASLLQTHAKHLVFLSAIAYYRNPNQNINDYNQNQNKQCFFAKSTS